MSNCYIFFVISLIILYEPVMSSPPWEFAVTTRNKINFFTSNWTSVRSVSHGFVKSTALALDEAKDTMYFNDEMHSDWAIFSIQSSNFTSHERIVQKLNDGKGEVTGIAFDPLENVLFWSDAPSAIIYRMTLGGQDNNAPEILIKLEESQRPDSIAIDVCRRKLYWTNRNPGNRTIEQISLDGKNRKVVIDDHLDYPLGIVVDQHTQRLFWIDDRIGEHFSIDSANLDGTGRKNVFSSALGHLPKSIAVDHDYVYWTDRQGPAIWSARKNLHDQSDPIKVHEFNNTEIIQTYAILAREHLLTAEYSTKECKAVVDLIKTAYRLETTTAGISSNLLCLNQGEFDPKSNSCKCQRGYKGANCEIPVCLNYCVEGEYVVSETGEPQCKCFDGFDGDRCEIDLCHNYCLNGGHCNIQNQKPICQCQKMYSGHRCDRMNFKEMCTRFCNKENQILQQDDIGLDLETVCNNCSGDGRLNLSSIYSNNYENHENTCTSSKINTTAILVSCGVVTSLALVVVIVYTIRKVYKPLRPRIKKTYVVHKNVTPTPLTCRPTTEQCEITIENCCNMNICDTPCFDPKTIQAELNKKEDKKTLLNHSEDLMY